MHSPEVNILVFLKGNQHLWADTFLWNQHLCFCILVKSTSLSLYVLLKSTFRCVESEINVFELTRSHEINIFEFRRSRRINISLCLKWNQHLWAYMFSWIQYFAVFEVKSTFYCVLSDKKNLCGQMLTFEYENTWRHLRVFLHTLYLENEAKTSDKNTGPCFSVTLKTTFKNSSIFEKNNFTRNCHLAWFCTHPFDYTLLFNVT